MKINIIILVTLINSLVTVGTEVLAQEEFYWDKGIIWKEEVPEEETTQDLEEDPLFNEETTNSSELGLDESEGSEDKSTSEVVPIEPESNQSSPTVAQEPNVVDTQTSKTEPNQVTESLSTGETNDNPTTITDQENSNQLNSSSEEIPALENTADHHGEILPSITYDPPIIPDHSATIKAESPSSVQAIIPEKSATSVEELDQQVVAVQSIDELECDNPATYRNDIREAYLPVVEIPLFIDINGQAISSIGLFEVKLEIPFGFEDFKLKSIDFKDILVDSSPCNARFIPETGVLTIPQIEVPTFINVANSTTQLQVGPTIKCQAVLQQSNLRISVLSLKELQCDSPLPVPVQTDIN